MAHGEMGFIPKSIAQMPVPVAMSSTLCTPSPRGARWSSPCNVNTNNWCCMSICLSTSAILQIRRITHLIYFARSQS